MKLTVQAAEKEDVYKDIARIPEMHRRSLGGAFVKEGCVCRVSVGRRSAYVLVRGLQSTSEPVICLDERKRNELQVALGAAADFNLEPPSPIGEWLWGWSASDPAYRVCARLALLSLVLGVIGLALGVIGLVVSLAG